MKTLHRIALAAAAACGLAATGCQTASRTAERPGLGERYRNHVDPSWPERYSHTARAETILRRLVPRARSKCVPQLEVSAVQIERVEEREIANLGQHARGLSHVFFSRLEVTQERLRRGAHTQRETGVAKIADLPEHVDRLGKAAHRVVVLAVLQMQ